MSGPGRHPPISGLREIGSLSAQVGQGRLAMAPPAQEAGVAPQRESSNTLGLMVRRAIAGAACVHLAAIAGAACVHLATMCAPSRTMAASSDSWPSFETPSP